MVMNIRGRLVEQRAIERIQFKTVAEKAFKQDTVNQEPYKKRVYAVFKVKDFAHPLVYAHFHQVLKSMERYDPMAVRIALSECDSEHLLNRF